MASCDALLAANIAPDCDNPQVGGIEEVGIIINRSDIDFDACTKDTTNPKIITDIALKSGKKGFSIYQHGNQPFNGTNASFTSSTYSNKFTKQVSFVVFDHSASASKNIIEQLANGTFVAILKNKYAGSDNKSKFEVFGFEAGLKQTEGSRDPYSDDTSGAWAITMQEVSPSSGLFFYKTSLAATEAAFESLLTAAVGAASTPAE